MFCPECGKPLLEKSTLCPSCGSALPELPTPEEASLAGEPLQSSPVQASASSDAASVSSPGEASAGSSLTVDSPIPSPLGSSYSSAQVTPDHATPSLTPLPPPPVIAAAPATGTAYSAVQASHTVPAAPTAAEAVPAGVQPAEVASIKLFFIISAVANFLGLGFWGLMSFVFVWVYLLGCLFMPLALITLAALVMDIVAVMKLNGLPGEGVYRSLKISCYLDCAAFCAMVPTIMGILNLMNLGKPEVKSYFNIH